MLARASANVIETAISSGGGASTAPARAFDARSASRSAARRSLSSASWRSASCLAACSRSLAALRSSSRFRSACSGPVRARLRWLARPASHSARYSLRVGFGGGSCGGAAACSAAIARYRPLSPANRGDSGRRGRGSARPRASAARRELPISLRAMRKLHSLAKAIPPRGTGLRGAGLPPPLSSRRRPPRSRRRCRRRRRRHRRC